jgi:hypothetical protein
MPFAKLCAAELCFRSASSFLFRLPIAAVCRIRVASDGTGATGTMVMNALKRANPKTNALSYFTFESPEFNREDAWKTGPQIDNGHARR